MVESVPDAPLRRGLVGGLCALAFATMLTYGIAGGAGQSLFISAYGSASLPLAWLGVAACSAVVTAALARAAQSLDIVQLFGRACACSAVSLAVLLGLCAMGVPGMVGALYVWKDVYIIVLVELFWTFANVAFASQTASRTYGLFGAAGSLGSVAGSVALGPVAVRIGTLGSLWTLLPMLGIIAWGCHTLARHVPIPEPGHRSRQGVRLRDGLAVLRNSPYLVALVALVAIVQAIITLTDFRFSRAIEVGFAEEEARTWALGNINAVINTLSLVLQLSTSAVLRTLGLQRTLLSLPVALGSMLLVAVWRPGLASATGAQVTGKCLDYSLFRAAKEMLYIPLSYAEKTQGKAIVDILTYRVAKGGVSMLLLGLGLAHEHDVVLARLSLVLCVAWFVCVIVILRRYRRVIGAPEGTALSG
jgi:AAA family ATP:ADP antiporter